jgi:NADH-quinone oxidoreductase subunit C
MTSGEAAKMLADHFGAAILETREFRGEVTVVVDSERLASIAAYCRDELGFNYLIDVSSVDHFGDEPRFEVVYELCILEYSVHLRLKTRLSEDEPAVATISNLWPTADWHEREVFDMMGIRFDGHPDLRRIIMWDGYPYHPLRKDFPLEGKPSDVPDVAFTDPAPLAGGPFVTAPTPGTTQVREPRARRPGDLPPEKPFIAEP